MKSKASYLAVDWPQTPLKKPENVHAFTTLRNGGFSSGDYEEYNLAMHVGDEVQSVNSNRAKLIEDLCLPAEPVWLEQVHSNTVICADDIAADNIVQADASFSRKKGVVCAVMTADCLPVFFCDQAGGEVHADLLPVLEPVVYMRALSAIPWQRCRRRRMRYL